MPSGLFAECPRCHKLAKGIPSIESFFGFRMLRGERVPQSHCKDCRAEETQETRRLAS